MKKQQNWEEKKPTAFYYSFKPRELKYFLFGKKRCPRCGGRLTRSKGSFTTKGARLTPSYPPATQFHRYHQGQILLLRLYLPGVSEPVFPGGTGQMRCPVLSAVPLPCSEGAGREPGQNHIIGAAGPASLGPPRTILKREAPRFVGNGAIPFLTFT